MVGNIEIILSKFKVHLNSKNKAIIKQINKYEAERADSLRKERLSELLATECVTNSLNDTAELIRMVEKWNKEDRERLDKVIAGLIDKLEPDSKQ